MSFAALTKAARDAALGVVGSYVGMLPANGEPYTVRGYFDDDHREVRGEGDAGVSTTGPMVSLAADQLQHELEVDEDRLEVRGQRYVIVDVQPDGQGTLDLILGLDDPEEAEE